jgi:hypothetical protein
MNCQAFGKVLSLYIYVGYFDPQVEGNKLTLNVGYIASYRMVQKAKIIIHSEIQKSTIQALLPIIFEQLR